MTSQTRRVNRRQIELLSFTLQCAWFDAALAFIFALPIPKVAQYRMRRLEPLVQNNP
jgi:hypothetical protein